MHKESLHNRAGQHKPEDGHFAVKPTISTHYGVATSSMLLEIIGLFCKRAL